MRTFVQAAPGVTRSCIGCHEQKKSAPPRPDHLPLAMRQPPARPQPESWGSGYIDYPSMVQPVLDKYCVRCHGGPEGMGKGLDFSGGWTWAFNISYETLLKHRLTGFLNCNNGSVHTSQILPPRTIGSGAAPLAEILIKKHPEVSRAERDLVLAWMDTNSNYYGTWDYTPHATCDAILSVRGPLAAVMQQAGCTACHAPGHIGNDWVNLQTPEWSRILRAPMAEGAKGGLGLAMCRDRKARAGLSAGRPKRAAARRVPAVAPAGVGSQRRPARSRSPRPTIRTTRPCWRSSARRGPRRWPSRGSTCPARWSSRASAGCRCRCRCPDAPPALAAPAAARRRRGAGLAADGRHDRLAVRTAPRPAAAVRARRVDPDRPDHRRPVRRSDAAGRHRSTTRWSSPRASSGSQPVWTSLAVPPAPAARRPASLIGRGRCPARSR